LDSFIFAFLFELIRRGLKAKGIDIYSWSEYLILLFVFKDIVFGKRSLGMLLLGIKIYDVNWETPRAKHILKRTFLMLTLGFVLMWHIKLIEGDNYQFCEWEKNRIKTITIDSKVYKRLKDEAEFMDGRFADNMTQLYFAYLRDLYYRD